MTFFDTHAHLDFPDFETDLDAVVNRAAEAGISRIITIGTNLESSRRAIQLSERYESIYAAVGWHPSHAHEAPEDIRPELRRLAVHPKVVAIGETGLDHHLLPSSQGGFTREDDDRYKARQVQLFHQHLEVATELGLNCVIHQRDCFDAAIDQLIPYADRVRGVFHCFVGSTAEMRRVVELGSWVSFTGILTFKNAHTIRETLAATPDDRFMLETDCPYLAPVPYRGKRCEPAYVRELAAVVAQTRACTLDALSRATSETAARFFGKMK